MVTQLLGLGGPTSAAAAESGTFSTQFLLFLLLLLPLLPLLPLPLRPKQFCVSVPCGPKVKRRVVCSRDSGER